VDVAAWRANSASERGYADRQTAIFLQIFGQAWREFQKVARKWLTDTESAFIVGLIRGGLL
jgi:hypothetical protein